MSLSMHAVKTHVPVHFLKLSEEYPNLGLSKMDATVYGRFYGIERIPTSHESILALIKQSAAPLVEALGADKKRIKYVIAPRTAPVISTFGTSLVRDLSVSLGLYDALPFVIGMNKCVSTLRAFEVAEILLTAGAPGDLALIVTGERIFTEQNRVLPNITIAADASASAVVGIANDENAEHRFLGFAKTILGEYAAGVWLPLDQVAAFGKTFDANMFKVIDEVLKQTGVSLDEVKVILPHNVNIPCWKGFAKYAGIPLEKIYLKNIPRSAHCFNSDLLLNWNDVLQDQILQRGDYYLMVTTGVGAMFGAALFQY